MTVAVVWLEYGFSLNGDPSWVALDAEMARKPAILSGA